MAVGMRLNCDEMLPGGYDRGDAGEVLSRLDGRVEVCSLVARFGRERLGGGERSAATAGGQQAQPEQDAEGSRHRS